MAKSAEVEKLKEKQSLKEEFIEFINRGSMIDLAVGVAVGGAFTAIVNSLVNDIVMPVVGLLLGGVDFTHLAIRVPNFFGTGDEAATAITSSEGISIRTLPASQLHFFPMEK